MATRQSNSKGKGAGGMDWGNPVRSNLDVGNSSANKDESDISAVVVICLGIMALTFVIAIPLLGMAYADMKAMTDLAAAQYRIMKEETRKVRELRAQIMSGE